MTRRTSLLFIAPAFVAACATNAAPHPSAPADARPAVTSKKLGPEIGKMNLPSAERGLPVESTLPTVSVVDGRVYRDADVVGDTSGVLGSGRLTRIGGLFDALKSDRTKWLSDNAGTPFPGAVLLAFDAAAPAVVVKSVFQTAAFAGYPNSRFAVRGASGVTRLEVSAFVPLPLGSNRAPPPGARLLIGVRKDKLDLVWRKDAATLATSEVPSATNLPARIEKDWSRFGVHRAANDPMFDQAILYVADEVDYAGIVAIVDAVQATTRELAVEGISKRVPALNVTLSTATKMSPEGGDPLAVAVNGRLPPEVIQTVVREHFGNLRACYEEGLKRNANLAGKVVVRFDIETSGKVSGVQGSGSTLPDAQAIECMLHAIEGLSFPRPEGGKVTVVYPVIFRSGDGAAAAEP
jgi:hypothetical protein